MGLEALLEAARFLEFQANLELFAAHNNSKHDGGVPKPNQSLNFQPQGETGAFNTNCIPGNNNETAEGVTASRSVPRKTCQRTQEQRAVHSLQVKGQREVLKSCLIDLENQLKGDIVKTTTSGADQPSQPQKRYTTAVILKKSLKLISTLKKVEDSREMEIEGLKQKNVWLETRLGALLDELQLTKEEAKAILLNMEETSDNEAGANVTTIDKDDDGVTKTNADVSDVGDIS